MDTTEKNELAQEFVNATLEFAKIVRPMCEIIGVDVVTMMAQDSLSQAIAKNAVSRIIEGDDEDAIDQVNELILQCSPPAEEIAALYEDMFLTMTPDEILEVMDAQAAALADMFPEAPDSASDYLRGTDRERFRTLLVSMQEQYVSLAAEV